MFSVEKQEGRTRYSRAQIVSSYVLVSLVMAICFFSPIAYKAWNQKKAPAEKIVQNTPQEEKLQRFGDFGASREKKDYDYLGDVMHFVRNYTLSGIVVDRTISAVGEDKVQRGMDDLVDTVSEFDWDQVVEGASDSIEESSQGLKAIGEGLGVEELFPSKERFPARRKKRSSFPF